MLPDGDNGDSSGRYGSYAMELLINEMMKLGARRETLQAKIFGGGQVMANFTTQLPVEIGNVTVHPGDYVLADASAAIFLRPALAPAVIEAAEFIAGREAAMAQALREGKPITEVMGANYEHLLKR
jgi:hypothetical protein